MTKYLIDIHFLQHVIECIEKQRIVSEQPNDVQTEWQNIIDQTIGQCKNIVEEAKKQSFDESYITPEILLCGDDRDLEKYLEEYDKNKR